MSTTLQLRPVLRGPTVDAREREQLERRVRLLAWIGNGWHLVEVAVGAGIAAGSIALIGFGADSLIEGGSGLVIVWLFTGSRFGSAAAELRPQRVVASSYFLLAVYITVESLGSFVGGHHATRSLTELESCCSRSRSSYSYIPA